MPGVIRLSGRAASKYRNKQTTVDGLKFPSRKEAGRWVELSRQQAAGLISDLKRQVRFPIRINGLLVCTYVADFVYLEAGAVIVEDCKGFRTPIYKLKAKLVKAALGITIRET